MIEKNQETGSNHADKIHTEDVAGQIVETLNSIHIVSYRDIIGQFSHLDRDTIMNYLVTYMDHRIGKSPEAVSMEEFKHIVDQQMKRIESGASALMMKISLGGKRETYLYGIELHANDISVDENGKCVLQIKRVEQLIIKKGDVLLYEQGAGDAYFPAVEIHEGTIIFVTPDTSYTIKG